MPKKRVYRTAAVALLNAVTVGIASTYSSTATESMKGGKINPSDEEISWIGSILPLGAILGGLVAGFLSDKIGRKGVMMYLSVFLVGGWLSISYAPSLSYVYIGRLLTGFCCGLICVVTPMYVVEISTPEIRGRMGTWFQLYICFGIIISAAAGKFLSWEWVAMIGAIFAVITMLCMIFIPESPRWLVMSNKHAEAVLAVNALYGDTNQPSVNQLINESLDLVLSTRKISLREVLLPTFYKPALLSIALMFFQQFSGSNAILYYTVSIFKGASKSIDPLYGNFIIANVMFFSTLITSNIIDTIGRKKSLYISGTLTCFALNGMSIYLLLSTQYPTIIKDYGWIPLLCLVMYIAGFSLGLGPIPWLMMSEMAPIRGRGLICGLGTAFSWIFVFIITKSFLQIEELVGNFGTYWIYSGFCLILCFFTFFFVPETKGKTMEEIEDYFTAGEPQLQPLPEVPIESFAVDEEYNITA